MEFVRGRLLWLFIILNLTTEDHFWPLLVYAYTVNPQLSLGGGGVFFQALFKGELI